MSTPHDEEQSIRTEAVVDAEGAADAEAVADAEESPEQVPPKAWVTYAVFAMFIIGVASCSPIWLFN